MRKLNDFQTLLLQTKDIKHHIFDVLKSPRLVESKEHAENRKRKRKKFVYLSSSLAKTYDSVIKQSPSSPSKNSLPECWNIYRVSQQVWNTLRNSFANVWQKNVFCSKKLLFQSFFLNCKMKKAF